MDFCDFAAAKNAQQQHLTPQQKMQLICTTMAKITSAENGAAKAAVVAGAVTVGTIVITGGLDSPFAGPVALGFGAAAGGFTALSLINTAVANWGLGCGNSW